MMFRILLAFIFSLAFVSCASTSVPHTPNQDLGILWVQHAAEYRAITMQVYQSAERALPGFVADQFWSALPEQDDAEGLPPAIIFDVDETVVSGADFQISHERPFTARKLYDFYQQNDALPVPGVVGFIAAARQAGVAIFFVTNRPCEVIDNEPDPCPQKAVVIEAILQIGVETDDAHVMLAGEQGWDRAKIGRRKHIAKNHRVIMLFGDDLGDFVPCVRTKLYGPCTEPATQASRIRLVTKYAEYWGDGWYILPGPMHGSWTSFK